MRLHPKVFQLLCAALLVVGPALSLPTLSAHAPILTSATAPASPDIRHRLILPLFAPLAGIVIRKDVGSIAKKFVDRANTASGDYKDGVAAAGSEWQTNALAGESNYEQGVSQAIADKRFGKGISAAGSQKYVENATKLGPQRYQTGTAQAGPAYMKGVQPHIDAMKSLDLPKRGPKGSAANQQRAQIVAARNREVKLGK